MIMSSLILSEFSQMLLEPCNAQRLILNLFNNYFFWWD